jgi:uncharacterized coiled-coil protein SlyX
VGRQNVVAFEARVAAVEERVDMHVDIIAGIRTDMATLAERVGAVEQRLGALEQRVERFEDKVDRRFERMEDRFDKLDDRMSRQFMWLVGVGVATLVSMCASLFAALHTV